MFIEFTFNPKLLFLLVFPAFREFEKAMKVHFLKDDNSLFHIFRIFLSNELSFIFLIIFNRMNKTKKKENIPNENEKNYEQKNGENKLVDIELKKVTKKNHIKSFLFLLFLSVLYSGSYFFNYFVGRKNIKLCRNTIGIIYEVIIFSLLSKFILKEKYYKHHIISSIIICLSLILLFISYFKGLEDQKYSIYNVFWYYLIYYFLYGLFNTLLKKYIIIYFHSIYYILLIIGTLVCVPMIIYDIITYHVKQDISGIILDFKENITSVKDFFLFFVETIFQFFSNLGIFWTIYYFTPFHFIISEFISELLNYYIKLIENDPDKPDKYGFIYYKYNIIIFSVVFFINLICSLIFNEIIILKFCSLEYYTKKYINKRATNDITSLFIDEDSINSEKESENNKDESISLNEN